jgi:glutathione S-transferase
VPIFEEDGFVLFETGAIVLYIGERSEMLLPKDPAAWSQITEEYITMSEEFDPKMHSENSPFKI